MSGQEGVGKVLLPGKLSAGERVRLIWLCISSTTPGWPLILAMGRIILSRRSPARGVRPPPAGSQASRP